jgi:hypothetical protein
MSILDVTIINWVTDLLPVMVHNENQDALVSFTKGVAMIFLSRNTGLGIHWANDNQHWYLVLTSTWLIK